MADQKRSADELIAEAKRFFDTYKKEIGQSIREDKRIIIVNFNDLSVFSHQLAEELLNSPEEILQLLETALDELGLIKNARVRFIEIPITQQSKIGHIRAKHLNKFISIEGIVRQASDVRPQVTNAKFECPTCGTIISVLQIEKKFREPTRCSCGRRGQFKLISKEMVDAQRLIIEESPESLTGGEQPRRLSVFLQEDLVEPKMEEKTTPGSKVKVIGVLKEVPVPLQTGAISTRYDLAVEANNIIPLEETYEEVKINEEDERQINELSVDPKIFEKLSESIAPSIWGYKEIKKALVLQMFGGVRKVGKDKSAKRGDIHILLMGDPGCLVGTERVVLGNGAILKIRDLGKEHLQKINTQILTGEGGKKRDHAKVFHIYKNNPVIEVITESGKSIKGTYNHPLLSISSNNGKIIREWKMLKDFKIGDKIAVTTSIPCTITKYLKTNFKKTERKLGPKFKARLPEYINPEFASLIGYMLGDGWVEKYRAGFVIAEPEKDISNYLTEICSNLFGITPKIQKKKIGQGRKIQLYYNIIHSKDIAYNLSFLREKRVPDFIFQSGNKVVSSFLRFLYEADGCVFNKGRGRRSISLKAKNIELLRDVQTLLLRFSIHSRIIGDSLMIRRGKEMIKFSEYIGFASNKKKTILRDLVSDAKSFKRFNSQRKEKITNIIFHKNLEDVYDIEVPNSHRFIANGIISHNTAKSQVLKFVSEIAPKGRYVVGRGTSGAGLTATVVRDEFLRGWALEAGAMVLASGGIVCIDELEKMDENDRSAMHEALEQQCVTISKANVQACYSEDTEVLTEEGWRRYNEVKDLRIAQYNPKNKKIFFISPKELFVYDYNGEMIHFKNKRNDILVTPNHKMLFKTLTKEELRTSEADKIPFKKIEFINSGIYENNEESVFILPPIQHKQDRKHEKYEHQHHPKEVPMDLWLEFIGYYVTEGGKETLPTVSITQKKGNNCDKIERCLRELAKYVKFTLTKIPYKDYFKFKITNTQLSKYLMHNCGEHCYEKRLPFKLTEFSKRQLKILFEAMMLGDGAKSGKSFGSTSNELSDKFQMLVLLLGKSSMKNLSYEGKKRGNRRDFYRTTITNAITPQLKKHSIKKESYNGKVFCFSTDMGFFITRRNGKVAIQGNSLKSVTSVLAAGNPKLGRFQPFDPIAQQIELPPTLINRFDVIFALQDLPDKFKDESIASHVLTRYQQKEDIVPIERDLFKKYIAYAKQKIKPILTEEAANEIKEFYVKMRNAPVTSQIAATRPIPISARQLEALVRLSEAHAKMRLSKKVTKEDAKVAIELIVFYLMQVGYDYETRTFDIDKIATGISTSQRSKVILLREVLGKLEERLGKFIPVEELEKELEGKLTKEDIDESIQKLISSGDIFVPRKGFVQKI